MTDWPSAERRPADPGADNRVRLVVREQRDLKILPVAA